MKRYLFTLLLSVLTLNVALAEATFTTIPPRQVIAGNKFNITFRLKDGEGSNITAPEIQGCTLLYGPSTSTMQSYQNINGRTTSSKTIDFSYVYRADTPGTYTIGEADKYFSKATGDMVRKLISLPGEIWPTRFRQEE